MLYVPNVAKTLFKQSIPLLLRLPGPSFYLFLSAFLFYQYPSSTQPKLKHLGISKEMFH